MNCEEMRAKLDAYIDGELPSDEMRAIEDHAAACSDCRREVAAAKLVRDVLGELDEEVAVPLPAHVGWQRAVRNEAKRRLNRRWMRVAYAAAAVLVLTVGSTVFLRNAPEREQAVPMTIALAPTDAVVARDGDMEAAVIAVEEEAYAAWKKYVAENWSSACASMEALIQEYSGNYTLDVGIEGDKEQAIYRIELPGEYLEDFLNAVSHVGTEQDSEMIDVSGETAIVYIQVDEF